MAPGDDGSLEPYHEEIAMDCADGEGTGDRTILVIENDEVVLSVARETLARAGFEVL